jgi:hypothetical protein
LLVVFSITFISETNTAFEFARSCACACQLQAILIFNFIDFTPLEYSGYVLPDWAQALGWLMAVASVGLIPIFAGYQIWRSYKQPEYDGCSFWMVRITTLTNRSSIPFCVAGIKGHMLFQRGKKFVES